MGSEIMAQHWFAALLKHDGREIPSWSEEEMKKAIVNPPKKVAGYGSTRRGVGGGPCPCIYAEPPGIVIQDCCLSSV